MKVVVSSTGTTLDSLVDPRFGRCPYFIVIDTENLNFESVPNQSLTQAHGAGIAAAQLVAKLGAETVLTGQVGPNAHMALSHTGITVVTGASGTVEKTVESYLKGQLSQATSPTVEGHFGQGGGRGGGRGRNRV